MPQTIHRGIKTLIDEANAEIETVSNCLRLSVNVIASGRGAGGLAVQIIFVDPRLKRAVTLSLTRRTFWAVATAGVLVIALAVAATAERRRWPVIGALRGQILAADDAGVARAPLGR